MLLSACAGLLAAAPAAAQASRHGGIEVGSKGVKVVAVEVNLKAAGNPVKVLYTKTANTTLVDLKGGEFRRDALDETAAAVKAFFLELTDPAKFNVPAATIRIVGSSGLPNVPNRADLSRLVKEQTGRDMTFIGVKEEVRLAILGLAEQADKDQALFLDVGSGNTKGGYLAGPGGQEVHEISLPYGSVTFTSKVAKAEAPAGQPFPVRAAALRDAELTRPLRQQADRDAGLRSRAPVYLAGGAVWAMTSLLHPDAADGSLVPLTAADVEAYRQLLAKDPRAFPAVDESKMSDKARATLRQVRDTFSPDNLIAGAEILKSLCDAFDLKDKKLFFARNGQVAWLLGYVLADAAPPASVAPPKPPVTAPPATVAPPKPPATPPSKPKPVAPEAIAAPAQPAQNWSQVPAEVLQPAYLPCYRVEYVYPTCRPRHRWRWR